ncbi:WcbI family polysaccharide biosynthesis putative acetyltransferase [Dietzia cinnamea]|uniref:WcbI family polysaccharide biosynthesis putative acetyltransferase n=1 Tax=Dietzia cinnamea TaxID=321318 RepID=UPI0021A96E4C|nr:WcbI family polysaccharide biosynthesis putative acetyltransferase [Dietzia cinnamea]MCT1710618.1 WcbI family polysaccharide biosynthesis putative acetyltransferase [Dietzia cinnamea]MCT2275650.1 WcbI family polysaccharide biosynthesis putative acetyltransferase [Dietzia cinnamea]
MSTPDRPTVMVIGNCQADVYRDLLRASDEVRVVEVRPVYEMTAADLPALHADLARTDVLIVQPVRDDYRDLPLGHRQLAAHLPASATVVLVPVLRYAGLHPYQVLVRPPHDRSLVPPLAPYHDLRTILVSATGDRDVLEAAPTAEQARAAARESVEALRVREQAHGTLTASDLLDGCPRWHTINHPDRHTLATVFDRILERLPAGVLTDPPRIGDREPLGSTRAPVEPAVARALGVTGFDGTASGDWLVDGAPVRTRDIIDAHLAWYTATPGVVEEGLRRHADRIDLLGLR